MRVKAITHEVPYIFLVLRRTELKKENGEWKGSRENFRILSFIEIKGKGVFIPTILFGIAILGLVVYGLILVKFNQFYILFFLNGFIYSYFFLKVFEELDKLEKNLGYLAIFLNGLLYKLTELKFGIGDIVFFAYGVIAGYISAVIYVLSGKYIYAVDKIKYKVEYEKDGEKMEKWKVDRASGYFVFTDKPLPRD
jgi:hypothetical protein